MDNYLETILCNYKELNRSFKVLTIVGVAITAINIAIIKKYVVDDMLQKEVENELD